MNKSLNLEKFKIDCRHCTLKELCFPHEMSNDDIDKLNNIIDRRAALQKKDYLYRTGDDCTVIYAVLSGGLKTTVEDKNGNSQIVGFNLPGEIIGFDGFATDIHTCSVEALETTSVCELPLSNLESLCESIPGLQKQMRRIMGLEVNSDHNLLLLLGKMNSDEKLAAFLVNLSMRNKQRHWNELEFNLKMTRQDIANYLGLAIETVSRLFSQFQDQGLIMVDKRNITILDIDSMIAISGEQ